MPKSPHDSARRRGFRPAVDGLEDRQLMTTVPSGFHAATVVHGLTRPTAFAVAPDGRLFVAQQGGLVRIVQNGKILPAPFLGVNVNSTQELGLDGIALDPHFQTTPYVYVDYTVPGAAGAPSHNRVSRFLASGNTAMPGSEQVLLDLPDLGAPFHVGGSLNFGPDGKLYIGVGDNTVSANSQSLANPLGKELRINPDGSIPTDNPFYNATTGVNQAIWAMGLRNPFTAAVQPGTNRLFINDVGLDTWEKVEVGTAGANYGWPISENPQGIPGLQSPVFAYMHGHNDKLGCAITGGAFDNPAAPLVANSGQGNYFFADLCGDYIHRLDVATGRVTNFASKLPNFTVDLAAGPDHKLYFLSRGKGPDTDKNHNGVLGVIQHH